MGKILKYFPPVDQVAPPVFQVAERGLRVVGEPGAERVQVAPREHFSQEFAILVSQFQLPSVVTNCYRL